MLVGLAVGLQQGLGPAPTYQLAVRWILVPIPDDGRSNETTVHRQIDVLSNFISPHPLLPEYSYTPLGFRHVHLLTEDIEGGGARWYVP